MKTEYVRWLNRKPVGQRIAIPRAKLLQRGQVRGAFVPLGSKAKNVRLWRHLQKGQRNRHDCDYHPDNPKHAQNDDSAKQGAMLILRA
jgi:hypothetical protein